MATVVKKVRHRKILENIFGIPHFDLFAIVSYVIPLAYIFIFLIVPLAEMLKIAFTYNGAFSLHWFKSIFSQEFYISPKPQGSLYVDTPQYIYVEGLDFGVILNSLIVAMFVTLLATLIGVTLAYVMYRYTFPGKGIFRVLLIVPLLMTPFVNAYVVKLIFRENGIFNWILHDLIGILPKPIRIDGLVGVMIAQAIAYYPIVYLNTYASFVNIDPSLEEQAENLGSRGFKLLRTITLPLALPGISAGATLTFIFSLEDLGAPIAFHSASIAKKLITYQIYDKFLSETGYRSPEIAALAIILLALSLLAFALIRKYVSLRQYAMMSKGGRWYVRTVKPKWWQYVIIYTIVLPLVLFTITPQIGVILLAFSKEWSRTPYPRGFTLQHISQIALDPSVRRYVINSITYAFIAILIIVVISVMASYVSNRFRGVLSPIVEALTVFPLAVPGIVIAIGYFYFFASITPKTSVLNPLSVSFNPGPILIIAYSIRRMPFTARSIYAGIQQVHASLEEAAMNLGSTRWKAVMGILVPLIAMNVLGGAMLSFVYAMSETSVSITIGSLEMSKAPMTAYMRDLIVSAAGSAHMAAALGFILIAVQISAIILSTIITKQRYAFIGIT